MIKGSEPTGEIVGEPGAPASDCSLIIDASSLLPGDVLLYRPLKPNMIQNKISSATSSPYTHAAIYVGDGQVAESVAWPRLVGVRKSPVDQLIVGSRCIGVLRTQAGFGGDRVSKLRSFVETVLEHKKFYNIIAALKFEKKHDNYFSNQLDFIKNNYENVTKEEDFATQNFICSAFIVACFSVVGIIGGSAQVAYPPEFFSPAGLHRDPTFGWFVGYLLPKGGAVPDDDPLSSGMTLWRDQPELQWWLPTA
jgi:hypothetical protein